jgi:hypothetical protein
VLRQQKACSSNPKPLFIFFMSTAFDERKFALSCTTPTSSVLSPLPSQQARVFENRCDESLYSYTYATQLYYGMDLPGSPLPVVIAPARACSAMTVSMASSSLPSIATAGLASQFLLTMRDASANAVSCNASALSIWLSGESFAAADVENDSSGACRVVFSVLEVSDV